jgi:hypothetical protein
MSIKSTLKDGTGTNREATVSNDHALRTEQVPWPPFIPQKVIPFRQFMTADGTASGSSDMLVNGSSTAVDFWVPAHNDRDRYISVLSIVLSDGGTFNMGGEFGNSGAPLDPGCRLFYTHQDLGEIDIHDALTVNSDFIRLGLGNPAFGASATVFRATNFIGTGEAILPTVDLKQFVPPYGIKLDKGSSQRLTMRIQDDLSSGFVDFTVIAYGFDRLE